MFEPGDKVIAVADITLYCEGELRGVIPKGTKGEVCGTNFNLVYDGEQSIDVLFESPYDEREVGIFGPKAEQYIVVREERTMENKLVLWAGNAEDKESLVKSIKEHLNVEYLIKERELTATDNGFRFLFDDETGSDIEISFSQQQDSLVVSVSGNCSWDVVRLYEEILAMLPDEEGVA